MKRDALKAENERLRAMCKKLAGALEYYSKPYENDGCWVGYTAFSWAHGDDISTVGAFSMAGKCARKALAEYYETMVESEE